MSSRGITIHQPWWELAYNPNLDLPKFELKDFQREVLTRGERMLLMGSTPARRPNPFYNAYMQSPPPPSPDLGDHVFIPRGGLCEVVRLLRYEDGGAVVRTEKGERWVKRVYLDYRAAMDGSYNEAPPRTHKP